MSVALAIAVIVIVTIAFVVVIEPPRRKNQNCNAASMLKSFLKQGSPVWADTGSASSCIFCVFQTSLKQMKTGPPHSFDSTLVRSSHWGFSWSESRSEFRAEIKRPHLALGSRLERPTGDTPSFVKEFAPP